MKQYLALLKYTVCSRRYIRKVGSKATTVHGAASAFTSIAATHNSAS